MAGLRETLSKLMQERQRLERLADRSLSTADLDVFRTAVGRLQETSEFGLNPGQLRMLSFAPRGLGRNAPLVVALHGCTQTAATYDQGSGWSALADAHGFALLMPQQSASNNANSCFNWFNPGDTRRDHGETLSIRQMIERMIGEHGIDRNRIFIVGLSAGGAMTMAMLSAYPDVFAGGAVIAGLPYGSAESVQDALQAMGRAPERSPEAWGELVRSASSHRGPWPRLSIWHGNADHIVSPKNAEGILRQWTDIQGLATEPDAVTMLGHHSRRVWRDADGHIVIESTTIAGMGHGVPLAPLQDSGRPGAFHYDVGLSSSVGILGFWGLGGVRTELRDVDNADALPPLSEPLAAEAVPASPGRRTPVSVLATVEPAAHVGGSEASHPAYDPREIITTTLRKAGLLTTPGHGASGDARGLIASTLRSVGLLKE